jgi:hypothetical protein
MSPKTEANPLRQAATANIKRIADAGWGSARLRLVCPVIRADDPNHNDILVPCQAAS